MQTNLHWLLHPKIDLHNKIHVLTRCAIEFNYYQLNPDFAVDFVMRVPNTIKTSVWTDFLAEDVMDYMEVKK